MLRRRAIFSNVGLQLPPLQLQWLNLGRMSGKSGREKGDARLDRLFEFAASITPATYSSEIGPLVGLIGTAIRVNTVRRLEIRVD